MSMSACYHDELVKKRCFVTAPGGTCRRRRYFLALRIDSQGFNVPSSIKPSTSFSDGLNRGRAAMFFPKAEVPRGAEGGL